MYGTTSYISLCGGNDRTALRCVKSSPANMGVAAAYRLCSDFRYWIVSPRLKYYKRKQSLVVGGCIVGIHGWAGLNWCALPRRQVLGNLGLDQYRRPFPKPLRMLSPKSVTRSLKLLQRPYRQHRGFTETTLTFMAVASTAELTLIAG